MPKQKTPEDTDEIVREIMFEIMAVLWSHGFTEVPTGALMRLMGVDKEHARKHDDEFIVLDDNFAKIIARLDKMPVVDLTVPPDAVIH
jgi:hypothetical protein